MDGEAPIRPCHPQRLRLAQRREYNDTGGCRRRCSHCHRCTPCWQGSLADGIALHLDVPIRHQSGTTNAFGQDADAAGALTLKGDGGVVKADHTGAAGAGGQDAVASAPFGIDACSYTGAEETGAYGVDAVLAATQSEEAVPAVTDSVDAVRPVSTIGRNSRCAIRIAREGGWTLIAIRMGNA